ncbi:hypothetical protein F2Q69_00037683 [Brassica cretica]|uniref:Uncharacterized protein n=1 Tax=Brassica cretica TaxID=69181 RepID=A0A8S9SBT9_BRACR|nr:hypothetical protein F2Q69_00037683 [Brassica cretica]
MASLGEIEFTYPGTERVYDLVNHIGGVFRYFIVDVVDPGSTPDVARCGRELVGIITPTSGIRAYEFPHTVGVKIGHDRIDVRKASEKPNLQKPRKRIAEADRPAISTMTRPARPASTTVLPVD